MQYDRNFRKHAETHPTKWAEANTSLSTPAFCNAQPRPHCDLCFSVDHETAQYDLPEDPVKQKAEASPQSRGKKNTNRNHSYPRHTQDPASHAQSIQVRDTTDGQPLLEDISKCDHTTSSPPASWHSTQMETVQFSASTVHTIRDGAYPYTADLLALASTSKLSGVNCTGRGIQNQRASVWAEWSRALQDRPCR